MAMKKRSAGKVFAFCLFALLPAMAAKPSYAGPGQWWVNLEQDGTVDLGTQHPAYPKPMADEKSTFEYTPLTSEDTWYGLGGDNGYLPENVMDGQSSEISFALNPIFPRTITNDPAKASVKLKWLDAGGAPATDSPPSSVTVTIRSKVGSTVSLASTPIAQTSLSSYPAFVSAIASGANNSLYTFVDNGWGDTPVVTSSSTQVDVTSDGSHSVTLPVSNGEASYDVNFEIHSWLKVGSLQSADHGAGASISVKF